MTEQEKPQENVVIHNFHSDKFNVEVKTAPKCRVTLVVKANPKLMHEAKQDAVKQVAKEVSIPGFRKGKAPAGIIESKYPGAIAQAWDKTFADTAFKESQSLAKIPVLNNSSRISYQVTTLTENQGEISFQFEREPEVPAIDYAKFSLKADKPAEISEEKVQETIKGIQMFYARWEQIHDRPIKEGDFVVLDIDDIDQDPPVQAFSNSRFEVREGKMAGWMIKAILGKNRDESIETVSEPDAHETEEVKKQFQPKKVKIHVKGIEEAVLPLINDDLAKKVGVPSVDVLHTQVKKLLTKQAADDWQRDLRDTLADQMLDTIVFEVPASMLEKEANFRLSQQFRQPNFAKKWKEEMSEAEKEAKKLEATAQAEHAIRLFYICRNILSSNNIAVSEDDLTPNCETILEMMFADPNLVNYKGQSREQQAIEFSKYMMAKAQDFIIEKIRAQTK